MNRSEERFPTEDIHKESRVVAAAMNFVLAARDMWLVGLRLSFASVIIWLSAFFFFSCSMRIFFLILKFVFLFVSSFNCFPFVVKLNKVHYIVKEKNSFYPIHQARLNMPGKFFFVFCFVLGSIYILKKYFFKVLLINPNLFHK